ncbi:MAG: glycoside hydrolase family 2 TIM barrel-domain containing protein, partial [Acidobacteriota bacterium]
MATTALKITKSGGSPDKDASSEIPQEAQADEPIRLGPVLNGAPSMLDGSPVEITLKGGAGSVPRPVQKSASRSKVAQFFISPPKNIPVVEGVRPKVEGKFIFVGEEKLYIRGVTYGPFRPEADGCEYHTPEMVERDFSLMAENGVNSVRTYTVPPRWLLDIAQRHGLRVMVGLPWEEHIAFLDGKKLAKDIERRVREGVRSCAGHP